MVFLLFLFSVLSVIGYILGSSGEALTPGDDPAPSWLSQLGKLLHSLWQQLGNLLHSLWQYISTSLSQLTGWLIAFILGLLVVVFEALSTIVGEGANEPEPRINPEEEQQTTAPPNTTTEEASLSQPTLESPSAEAPIEGGRSAPTITAGEQQPPAAAESSSDPSRVVLAHFSNTNDPSSSQAGIREDLEWFKAMEKRWKELYGDQTPQDVRERARRLMAEPGIEGNSSNRPLPPTRPGLAGLLEDADRDTAQSGAPGGGLSSSIVTRRRR